MKLDLSAARNRTIPDVLPAEGAPLHVLFCGINPGLYSAATGWHFARPGNRFWPALHLSGFTPRLLAPSEQDELARLGLGITNIAPRPTAQAAELTGAELRDGAVRLQSVITEHRPRCVAVAGVTAYRTAFGRPRAAIGPQDEKLGTARLWVLPNPSGLNASWPLPRIVAAFRELRAAVGDNQLCEKSKRRHGQNSIYVSSWPEVPRWGRLSNYVHEPDRLVDHLHRWRIAALSHRIPTYHPLPLAATSRGWQERWDTRHCCHGPRAARPNAGPAYLAATPPDLLLVPGGKDARRRDPDLVAWLAVNIQLPRSAIPSRHPTVTTGQRHATRAGLRLISGPGPGAFQAGDA